MSIGLLAAPVAAVRHNGTITPIVASAPMPTPREPIATGGFTTQPIGPDGAVILFDALGYHCGTFTSRELAASTLKFLGT